MLGLVLRIGYSAISAQTLLVVAPPSHLLFSLLLLSDLSYLICVALPLPLYTLWFPGVSTSVISSKRSHGTAPSLLLLSAKACPHVL